MLIIEVIVQIIRVVLKFSFFIYIILGGDDSGGDSTDSEYLPKKAKLVPSPLKRRGRPRKDPNSPPKPKKPKVPGRGRGRPPTKALIKKEREEEEIGEFPCCVCGEMFNTIMKLDKHARMLHEGAKVSYFLLKVNVPLAFENFFC